MITPLYHPIKGGAETVVKEHSERLVRRGHSVTVLTSRVPNTNKTENVNGVLLIRPWRLAVSCTTGMIFHLTTFVSLFCYALLQRGGSYNIVHCHMTHYPLIIGLLMKRHFLKTKIIATSHGSDLNVWGHNPAYRWLLLRLMNHIDWFVVVSVDLIRVSKLLGMNEEQVRYIPNGVDSEFLHIETRENPEYDVLFFGGIKWQKGLQYLLEAASLVAKTGKELRVAIAGNGPDLSRIHALSDRLNLKLVAFLGERSTDDIKNLLSNSTLAVFPSITEGLPCALLEAMAAAKPIIATSVGGMTILEHNIDAVLVPPKRSQELAEVILNLIGDQQKQKQISLNARKKASSNYLWERIIEMQIELYREDKTHVRTR